MNVLPALTTVYSAPSACATHWTWTQSANPATVTLWHDLISGSAAPEVTSCYPQPSGTSTWGNPNNIGTYSPGICPSGQTTVGVWWDATTTTAVCCSSGYTYTGNDIGCTSSFEHSTTTVTVVDVHNGKTATSTSSMVIESGEAIQFALAVMYERDDLTLFPSNAQPIQYNGTQPTVTVSPSKGAPADSDADSSGLSGGAIAAIVIGIALALSILFNLALLVMYRRRHSPTPSAAHKRYHSLESTTHAQPKAAEATGAPAPPTTHELPADQPPRAELTAANKRALSGYYEVPAPLESPDQTKPSADAKFHEISPVEASTDSTGDTLEKLEMEEKRLAERRAQLLQQAAQKP